MTQSIPHRYEAILPLEKRMPFSDPFSEGFPNFSISVLNPRSDPDLRFARVANIRPLKLRNFQPQKIPRSNPPAASADPASTFAYLLHPHPPKAPFSPLSPRRQLVHQEPRTKHQELVCGRFLRTIATPLRTIGTLKTLYRTMRTIRTIAPRTSLWAN